MGHRTLHSPLVVALGLVFLLALAPNASADQVICAAGSGAGQCKNPAGVAVDSANGRVYALDSGNNRVDVFDSSGSFLFAFGWKVSAAAPEEKLQICVTACQAGSSGPGAGQLGGTSGFTTGLNGIAVDSGSHDIYISEANNHRVQKFDSEGHFLLMFGKGVNTGTSGKPNICTNAGPPTDICGAGGEGSGAGQFNSVRGLALAPGGNVYVADSKSLGDCEGQISKGEEFSKRVQKFSAAGEVLEAVEPTDAPCGLIQGLVVDSTGDFYLASDGGGGVTRGVRKYHPNGASYGSPYPIDQTANISALAVDPADNLFVADNTGHFSFSALLEYDPTGTQSRLFYATPAKGTFSSLAFYGGDLYATEQNAVLQIPLPDPGPLLVPGSTGASPVGNVRATLKVSFNPEGKASTAHFEYVDKESFEKEGGFSSPSTQITPPSTPSPAGFTTQTASATNACALPTEATCLKPGTTYYFRPIASNADGEVKGETTEFTTLPPLQIPAIWATEVGTDSARLHAEVNPLGIHATARFQYIEEGPDYQANGFQHAIDVPDVSQPLDFGSAEAPLARSAQLYPLKPGTAYHYRLVAEDPYFPPVASPARSFATFALPTGGQEECPNQTFRTGPSATLPDCRAYEMVSPLDKNNGDILTLTNQFGYPTNLDQSSVDGSGFTYSSYRGFGNPKSAPYASQFLATRDPSAGWQSESIDPQGKGTAFFENPYAAFSPDLGSAWLARFDPPPAPCAPAGFTDVYRRDSSSGAFEALSCVQPKLVEPHFYVPELEGFSNDDAKQIFRADAALTANASSATVVNPSLRPVYQLYMSIGGQLQLISVLPNGEAASKDSSAGTGLETNPESYWNYNRFGSLDHAVSEDGTRVFWSTGGALGPIYLRTNADQPQSKIVEGKCSQPTKACTIAVSETIGKEPAFFQAANPQGTKALFTAKAGPLDGNLYEFDSEVEPPASQLIAKGVLGGSILGAGEDLSRVYYASKEASPSQQAEGAINGEPNVYLAEAGTARFVATLSSGSGETSDVNNPYGTPISISPIERTARVGADGQSLVFMSNSLALAEASAGYDNADALSGEADAEVYLYDASANEGKGKLRCVSCSPSGARPLGRELLKASNDKIGPWAAATIPPFRSQLYQPRYLSEDGKRVFFNSFDPLVLADTNGKEDVYQWEAVGSGDCVAESPAYVPGSEGCLGLISSGQSPGDSEFLDASPLGADVFFTTSEGLLPQDYGLIDVYDARSGGGFPPPASAPPSCEGEACQGSPQAPNDPTPASSAFEGAGNVGEAPQARCAKGKRRVLRDGKTRCVRTHRSPKRPRKQKHLHRRAAR